MASKSATEAIAATLEELTKAQVTIVNNRDWSLQTKEAKAVLPHISSDYQAFWVNLSEKQGLPFSQALQGLRSQVERNPAYFEEIVDIFTDLDEDRSCAKVIMHVRSVGFAQITSESIREARWRRDGHGKWWLWQHKSVRGMSMDHFDLG